MSLPPRHEKILPEKVARVTRRGSARSPNFVGNFRTLKFRYCACKKGNFFIHLQFVVNNKSHTIWHLQFTSLRCLSDSLAMPLDLANHLSPGICQETPSGIGGGNAPPVTPPVIPRQRGADLPGSWDGNTRMHRYGTPMMIEGSFEVKLPDNIGTDGKAEVGRSQRGEERGKNQRRERVRKKKKMQVREPGGKVAIHCVSPMICGSGGSKSRLAEAAGAKPCGHLRNENFQVKMYQAHHARTTFGSWDVEKVDAIVARSTFSSQKCTKHTNVGPLLEVAMWKVRDLVGAKHISKSKFSKHLSLGALLQVEMSKKCTSLCREAHVQVKKPFLMFRCRFPWQVQGILHLVKSEQKRESFVAVSNTTATVHNYNYS